MANEEKVYDSPSSWVKKHINEYVETDGEKGHKWRPGVPALLLTTRGRKTGKLRRTALIYGQDGDNYLTVASKGGAPEHPNWYLNLRDNPEVELQVGADKFKAVAHTASAEEKARLWPKMVEIWPAYEDYQKKTDREIPVVVLERVK
jgi:deazaflavin-dependent oxidoreductase (nitroreductase family)